MQLLYIFYQKYKELQISGIDKFAAFFWIYVSQPLVFIYNIYRTIRDKDDYIEISQESFKFKDNELKGTFQLSQILSAESSGEGIALSLSDGRTYLVETEYMNFSVRDKMNALEDLRKKINQN